MAIGYERVVIGGRGPYIEFTDDQIQRDAIRIPTSKEYKLHNSMSYYHEYRSDDSSYVKVYYQKIGVQYADYKVGYWYISPEDLLAEDIGEVMGPLYYELQPEPEPKDEPEETLFDVL